MAFPWQFVGPATTQKLVVKFDGEICGGVLVENASDDFPPAKEARESPSKLRRKFTTNFAKNFANFTLEIAGAYFFVALILGKFYAYSRQLALEKSLTVIIMTSSAK